MSLQKEKNIFADRIIDSHCHSYSRPDCEKFIMNYIMSSELAAVNVASLSKVGIYDGLSCNKFALSMKRKFPGKIYMFASLDYADKSCHGLGRVFTEHAKKMIESGADGFKMVEGKPSFRKATGLPLDSILYDPFYSLLEEKSIPLLMHVADPEEFWDAEKISDASRARGWFWGDGGYLSKEDLYKEAEGILTKHPDLKIIFAHFYFMSANITKASAFLDQWPNVSFDITPGWEMYHNFSKDSNSWKDFFNRYQERILFGTDGTSPAKKENNYNKPLGVYTGNVPKIRDFLEKDIKLFSGQGLKLGIKTLEKIYSGNFLKLLSWKSSSTEHGYGKKTVKVK